MFRSTCAALGKALVLVELSGGKATAASLATITAAKKCGPVTALVAGAGAKAAADAIKVVAGVDAVLACDNAQYTAGLPEELAPLVGAATTAGGFTHVFAPTGAWGKGVIPRVAAKFDAMPLSDIVAVVSEDTFVRQAFAGNVVSTVKSSDKVKFATVRGTAFDRAATSGGSATVTELAAQPATGKSSWLEDLVAKSDKPALESAPVVVSGGRGFKNKESFYAQLDPLAKNLSAAVGATRAMVDAGHCPNDIQVGQTGKVVAPKLYLALGLSGAIQHVAGMKDSKVIVAINTDAEAPIFSVADYGLVEDVFTAVPKLTALTAKK